MNNAKETLRKFFRISTAAFDFQRVIITSLGHKAPDPSIMEIIHKQALIEIEKDHPNMELIDKLLAEMALLAEDNNNKK